MTDRSARVDADVSAREAEVLALVGARLSNAEIARRLFISVRTVESHVSSLLRKLGAADRRELASLAASSGSSSGDYRAATHVAAEAATPVRYAQRDGLNIAYQVTGTGPVDLVLVAGFVSHLTLDWTGLERILRGIAATAGAPAEPTIESIERFPVVVNDPDALERSFTAFRDWLGPDKVFDPGAGAGSEDVGVLATSAGAPLSYWLLGGADPALFSTGGMDDPALRKIPSNHSPKYAPALEPTLDLGVTALVTAARTWLPT